MAFTMRSFAREVPWFLPSMAIWTVLAIIVSKPLARFLETRRIVAFGLAMSIGLILSATLSPTAPGLGLHRGFATLRVEARRFRRPVVDGDERLG